MSGKRMIAPYQVKLIHIFKSLLRRDDETYRGCLKEMYGVTTSKDLSFAQAAQFIGFFQDAAERFGLWSRESYGNKYKNLGQRIDMATPAQLRMVEGIWADLYPETDDKRRQAALSTYLQRFFHVSHPRFLDIEKVSKVLHALKQMQARKEGTLKRPSGGLSGPESEGYTRVAGRMKFKRV